MKMKLHEQMIVHQTPKMTASDKLFRLSTHRLNLKLDPLVLKD